MRTVLLMVLLLPLCRMEGQRLPAISFYGSGITRPATEQTSAAGREEIRSWEGALGVAFEWPVHPQFSLEVAVERRRDIIAVTSGGRLCGPVRNTCFDTHRMEISSSAVLVAGRIPWRLSDRIDGSTILGVRYVPRPTVKDLTPEYLVPRFFFGVDVEERINGDVGIAVAGRVTRRVSLFAEFRMLTGKGSAWDRDRRMNLGIRLSR